MKIQPDLIVFFSAAALLFSEGSYAGEGGRLYLENCAVCHGRGGEGLSASALRKEGMLRTSSHDYFTNSIRFGRPIRGCPSFEGKIPEDGMKDIASHIKGWQEEAALEAPAHNVIPKKTARGEDLFTLCGGCHGLYGEGAMGPPLLDPGFLKSISDADLRRTIMWGRAGTPMKGYIEGRGGLAVLSEDEIDELISYIRYRQTLLK